MPNPTQPSPYPARTTTTTITLDGTETVLTSISLSDKLILTITQHGRLNHWIHVPLDVIVPEAPPIPSFTNSYSGENGDVEGGRAEAQSDLLPMSHLTATTILGGRDAERETFGQLLATQIASAVVLRNSEERRVLVLGLGLDKAKLGREGFLEVVEGALGVI